MVSVSVRDPDALTVDEHWRQWEQEMLDRDTRARRRRRQVSWAAATSALLIGLLFLVS
jgi:hypothetical protein